VSYPPPPPPGGGQPGWQPPQQGGGWGPQGQQGWQPPSQPGYGAGGGGFGGGWGGGGYDYAEWPLRVGAALLAAAPSIAAGLVLGLLVDSIAVQLLFNIPFIVYGFWLAYEDGAKGQNWAKRMLGLKVVKKDTGQTIGGGLGIVRSIAHILDALPCGICLPLGFLWPLWDKDKQTFADKIMGTVVIKVPKA
jgi:uncharacterized RDD family membrane protein YckC